MKDQTGRYPSQRTATRVKEGRKEGGEGAESERGPREMEVLHLGQLPGAFCVAGDPQTGERGNRALLPY